MFILAMAIFSIVDDFLNWGDVKELGPNPKLNVSLVNVARKGFKKSVARLLEARSDPNMILAEVLFAGRNKLFMSGPILIFTFHCFWMGSIQDVGLLW